MNVSPEIEFGARTERAPTPARAGRERLVALDPLRYPGWDALLADWPGSSIFHTTAWARVLAETYGHVPVYVCRFTDDRLEGLLPVMEVSSLVTGRRGVSLPFTDFCPPLAAPGCSLKDLYGLAAQVARQRRWRFLEYRSNVAPDDGATPSLAFWAHIVELDCGGKALFDALDGAVRRGIRKAEAAQLQVEFDHRPAAVQTFYALHCRTRRRHGVPPQPFRFFANLGRHVLEPAHGFIVTARLGGRAVAAAVFLHAGRRAIFKFGAWDYAFQHLRPNNLLLWRAIEWYADHGFVQLHLGRTAPADDGLRRFKRGFGARETPLVYYRLDLRRGRFVTDRDRAEGAHTRLFRYLPLPLLRWAGALLYPHLS